MTTPRRDASGQPHGRRLGALRAVAERVDISRRYRLGERIGQGGMAEVFLAILEGAGGFERAVAVKRVRRELARDRRFAELFMEEARTAARLSHPNVVSALDLGHDGEGRLCLVMERVDGMSLAELLGTGPLPCPVAAFIAGEMLSGLGYAHALALPDGGLGIVHRDVSPENVLLSREGAVKVADFGIARAIAGSSSAPAPMWPRGKASYSSPEQLLGRKLDGRSDLFAAGIVLWEMLAARRLFLGAAPAEVAAKIVHRAVGAPSAYRDVPAALEAVAMRLLERDPGDRYQTAGQALADLLAWDGMPRGGRGALAELLAERLERRGAARAGDAAAQASADRVHTAMDPPEPPPGRPAVGSPLADVLGFDAYLELLDAAERSPSPCPSRDVALAHLLFHTGLGGEALAALDLFHLDLEGRALVLPAPKGAAPETVELNDLAVHALERYLADRPSLLKRGERLALFVSDRGRRLPRRIVRRLVRPPRAAHQASAHGRGAGAAHSSE